MEELKSFLYVGEEFPVKVITVDDAPTYWIRVSRKEVENRIYYARGAYKYMRVCCKRQTGYICELNPNRLALLHTNGVELKCGDLVKGKITSINGGLVLARLVN